MNEFEYYKQKIEVAAMAASNKSIPSEVQSFSILTNIDAIKSSFFMEKFEGRQTVEYKALVNLLENIVVSSLALNMKSSEAISDYEEFASTREFKIELKEEDSFDIDYLIDISLDFSNHMNNYMVGDMKFISLAKIISLMKISFYFSV